MSQRSKGVVYMADEEQTSSIQGNCSQRIYVKHVPLNMMKMKLHGGHSFGGTSHLAVEILWKLKKWWWGFERVIDI